MRCDDARPDAGFATLETLVAFVILSLVLVAASQSIVLAVRSLVSAAEQRETMEAVRVLLSQPMGERATLMATGASRAMRVETIDLAEEKSVAVWIKGLRQPILTFLPESPP